MNMTTTTSRFALAAAASAALLTFAVAPVHAAGGGANSSCGTYCAGPTAPSSNGVATTQPAAGTKGQADDKNPPGQASGGTGNRGYECSINQGVARGNPAHTGCTPDPDPGTDSGGGTGYDPLYPWGD